MDSMKFCSPSRLLAALLAAALLTGCSNPLIPPTEEPPAATVSGSVSIGLAAPLSGAYLFTTAWGDCEGDADIRELIFGGDTVVPTGEGTFASNPVVVSSVTQTEEPNGDRTYLFTLNTGLCYNDGTPITAQDYVFSILLQSSPEFASLDGAGNSLYQHLVGWSAFSSGESAVFSGVHLLSDTQFSMTIDGGFLPDYHELSLIRVQPLPMAVLAPGASLTEDGGAGWSGVTADGLAGTILGENGYRYHPSVTAGPYSLTAVSDGSVQLTANPYYTGAYTTTVPSIETLNITSIEGNLPDGMGDYDLLCSLSGAGEVGHAVTAASRDKELQTFFYNSAEVTALLVGESLPVNERQGLAAVLNQDRLTDRIAGRYGSPVTGLVPTGAATTQNWYSDLRRFSAQWDDLTLAEILLGDGMPSWTLIYPEDDSRAEILAEEVSRMAGESGLVEITPEALSREEVVARQLSGDYELLYFSVALPAGYSPWKGPEQLGGGELARMAEDLCHTSGGLGYRYDEEWLRYQQQYQQELPALAICGYERCDLVSPELEGYTSVTAWADWTTAILSAVK